MWYIVYYYLRVKAYTKYGSSERIDDSQCCSTGENSKSIMFPENGCQDTCKATSSAPFQFSMSQIVAYFITHSVTDGKRLVASSQWMIYYHGCCHQKKLIMKVKQKICWEFIHLWSCSKHWVCKSGRLELHQRLISSRNEEGHNVFVEVSSQIWRTRYCVCWLWLPCWNGTQRKWQTYCCCSICTCGYQSSWKFTWVSDFYTDATAVRITGSKCGRILSQKEKTVSLFVFVYTRSPLYICQSRYPGEKKMVKVNT